VFNTVILHVIKTAVVVVVVVVRHKLHFISVKIRAQFIDWLSDHLLHVFTYIRGMH